MKAVQKIYHVDAFTDRVFSGNPAGVCILDTAKNKIWMQNVAAEMNLSETAFLIRQDNGFHLRWFTPIKEVDLCGHATLASAHILWETSTLADNKAARFTTKSGLLTARRKGDFIELDFPIEEAFDTIMPENLNAALNAKITYVGKNRMDYILEVESEEIVKKMEPDFGLLKTINTRGIIVTAKSASPEYDFVSRFFAPAYGINEDPVTGSAHCCLGPYWKKKLGKNEVIAYQASKRGGFMKVRVGLDRVYLSGQAVTVFSAEMKTD